MRVVQVWVLQEYCDSHADLRSPAEEWLRRVRSEVWDHSNDLKSSFPSASLLGSERVVFNLKENRYRLLAKVDYEKKRLAIRRVGTHAEYSRWKL